MARRLMEVKPYLVFAVGILPPTTVKSREKDCLSVAVTS